MAVVFFDDFKFGVPGLRVVGAHHVPNQGPAWSTGNETYRFEVSDSGGADPFTENYRLLGGGTNYAMAGWDDGYADGTLTTVVRQTNASDNPIWASGVYARFTDLSNFVFAGVNYANNTFYLWKRRWGTVTVLDSASVTLSANTDYKVELVLNGDSLTATLDDTYVLSATESLNQASTVKGVFTRENAYWDYVKFENVGASEAAHNWPQTRAQTGLVLRFDASDADSMYQDLTTANKATTVGDPVQVWRDLSGGGAGYIHHARQGSNDANDRPTLQDDGTHPHLSWDGVDDSLFNYIHEVGWAAWTLVLRAKINDEGDTQPKSLRVKQDEPGFDSYFFEFGQDNAIQADRAIFKSRQYNQSDYYKIIPQANIDPGDGQWRTITFIQDNGTITCRVDGQVVDSLSGHQWQTINGILDPRYVVWGNKEPFGTGTDDPSNINIFRAEMYDSVLSGTALTDAESWAAGVEPPESDDLTAQDVATAAPTVESATLGQSHALAAQDVTAQAPTIGAPPVTQTHQLMAQDVATGTPTVEAPDLGQTHGLNASDVVAGIPSIGSATLGQTHALAAQDLSAGAPTVQAASLTGEYDLTAQDVATAAPTVESATLGQSHALAAQDVTAQAPTIGAATLGQVHALTAQDVATAAPTVESPTTSTAHGLTAVAVDAGVPAVAQPVLAQTHALTAQDVVAGPATIEPATLMQTHGLIAQDVTAQAPTVGMPVSALNIYYTTGTVRGPGVSGTLQAL